MRRTVLRWFADGFFYAAGTRRTPFQADRLCEPTCVLPPGQKSLDSHAAIPEQTNMTSTSLDADHFVTGSETVGLAVAWHLRDRDSVVMVDKEPTAAFHQTGRNSGVVHSGIYYQPGSLKAQLCTDGRLRLESFASDHGVPMKATEKLIFPTVESKEAGLDEPAERGEEKASPGYAASLRPRPRPSSRR